VEAEVAAALVPYGSASAPGLTGGYVVPTAAVVFSGRKP
jgi:hypothetical protein